MPCIALTKHTRPLSLLLIEAVLMQHTEGVYTAREFVWWYNGHPEYCNLPIDLTKVKIAIRNLPKLSQQLTCISGSELYARL